MTLDFAKSAVVVAKQIQNCANRSFHPPSEITASPNQPVLPKSLYERTRGYIERVAVQINRTYEHTCYDACAVMIRRLVEILIIEAFEHHNLAATIKNASGDYVFLNDLVDSAIAETTAWTLGRSSRRGLRKLKAIGDQSAHSRRYNARREYIDDIIIELRTVVEEFVYLSGIRT